MVILVATQLQWPATVTLPINAPYHINITSTHSPKSTDPNNLLIDPPNQLTLSTYPINHPTYTLSHPSLSSLPPPVNVTVAAAQGEQGLAPLIVKMWRRRRRRRRRKGVCSLPFTLSTHPINLLIIPINTPYQTSSVGKKRKAKSPSRPAVAKRSHWSSGPTEHQLQADLEAAEDAAAQAQKELRTSPHKPGSAKHNRLTAAVVAAKAAVVRAQELLRLSQAVPVDIRGATGPNASTINGAYEPTKEICGGWPVYRKQGDPDIWLEYTEANNLVSSVFHCLINCATS